MSRTERLLELMIRLRSRGHFTVQELADECGVSRRTMLRDLQALSELGVPLASTPGPGGGYTLAYPSRLVSPSLSVDEALGLIVSYEALLAYAESPLAASSLSAITKLRAALPPDTVGGLDRLRERVAMIGPERVYHAPLLPALLQAALAEAHLRIGYDSRGGTSERLIYPYGLVAALGFWYCACYDYRRAAHAWLRADRVLWLERVEGTERHEPMSLQQWLRRSPDVAGPLVRLHVTVTAAGMKDLDWSPFASHLARDDAGNGRIDLMVPAANLDYYARLFIRLGGEATVHAPPALIALLRERAEAVVARYMHQYQ